MILLVAGEKYDISADNILNVEAIAVKKKIGLDFAPWMDAIGTMNPEAVTALVWIAKKRQEPTTKFEDISFPLMSIDFELTEDEKRAAEEAEKEAGPKDEDTSSQTENS